MTSLIIDLETLDTAPTAIITEIGAIAVDRERMSIIDTIDIRPNILTQLADGRTHSRETIEWAARKKTLPDRTGYMPLKKAMADLMQFIEAHQPHRIWAWGKDFERPLIENACSWHCIEIPAYQFRKFSCGRDHWQTAFGMETKPTERTHHALQDCHDELTDITKALVQLNSLAAF